MHDRKASFGYRISLLHRLIARFIRDSHAPLGIEQGQVSFLAELFHTDGVPQEELSRRLHIDKGVTARQLARLEKAGCITRCVNGENRRQNLVYLSDAMRARRDAFYAPLNTLSDTLANGFSPEERRMALDLLERMMANMLAVLEPEESV